MYSLSRSMLLYVSFSVSDRPSFCMYAGTLIMVIIIMIIINYYYYYNNKRFIDGKGSHMIGSKQPYAAHNRKVKILY